MDEQTRITRLEAERDSMRENLTRLQISVDHLQNELVALRTHVDDGFEKQRNLIDKQREHFDQKLAEERTWAEANFKEIRASIEHGFAESRSEALKSRAEAKKTQRWLIGLIVPAVIALLGIVAKFIIDF